jgi:predicted cupin superfamily sugar epimerase
MLTADKIIALLNLKPHPEEGGYFVETYRSSETLSEKALPSRYKGVRSFGTAIYYLLTPETFSTIHRLQSDEIFHFYLGDPVEMLQLWPDGSGRILILGTDIMNGMKPQAVIPKGFGKEPDFLTVEDSPSWARRFHRDSNLLIMNPDSGMIW